MEWKKLRIARNTIEKETDKAYLIDLPQNADYPLYSFWLSKKLVHDIEDEPDYLEICYTNEFIFDLKQYADERDENGMIVVYDEQSVKPDVIEKIYAGQ